MKHWLNKFHNHLDQCQQCRDNPFGLCRTGDHYLKMNALTPEPTLSEKVVEVLKRHDAAAMDEVKELVLNTPEETT